MIIARGLLLSSPRMGFIVLGARGGIGCDSNALIPIDPFWLTPRKICKGERLPCGRGDPLARAVFRGTPQTRFPKPSAQISLYGDRWTVVVDRPAYTFAHRFVVSIRGRYLVRRSVKRIAASGVVGAYPPLLTQIDIHIFWAEGTGFDLHLTDLPE